MKKLLLGYRDNMRVEIETDVAVTASKGLTDIDRLAARYCRIGARKPRLTVIQVI